MHRVTIKPENGRVGLKAHSRASSAVENSHNLPPVYTWFNRDACACVTMMKEGMKREGSVFFFFFFDTRNVGAARIPDFVRGYLFNWPRCASSNNTCYALKLERVYFRSRPPFLAVWRSTIGRFVFPAPPTSKRSTRYTFSDYWNVDQATVCLIICLLNFRFTWVKSCLGRNIARMICRRGFWKLSILETEFQILIVYPFLLLKFYNL